MTERPVADLPAWSLPADEAAAQTVATDWPEPITREWAWGGSTGEGVRVAVVDSGVDGDHPAVGRVARSVRVDLDDEGEASVHEDEALDVSGHGTACAGIVRSLAPDCELTSVRVLGADARGRGGALVEGVRWAVRERHDVVNLSLSTSRRDIANLLHDIADDAYFGRTLLVASAHNLARISYPWRFGAVISVGSHERPDPFCFFYNPDPPVEFYARGVEVDVAWLGGETHTMDGNSFATPHIAGLCALVLGKHPALTPFQVKSVLHATASNAA